MLADLWAIMREPLNGGDRHPTLGAIYYILRLLYGARSRMGERFPRVWLANPYDGRLRVEWGHGERCLILSSWGHIYHSDGEIRDLKVNPSVNDLVAWLEWLALG